ncbi:hypothetical protein [Microbacterium sp.]|uniref:hypothetical protein n=1 Tax=Microbacterium sp. TaxID=51671 RepID=UPI003A943B0F
MSTRLDKTIALTALAVGPLSLIVTNIAQWMLQPTGPDPTATSAAVQFPTAWLVIGVLSVFGPLVWLAGLPATAALAPARGRIVTAVGALVTGAGLAAAIGHLAAFFGVYGAIAAAGLPGDGTAAMESAADAEPLGNILLVVFLVCYSLGPIVLTVGLRIARRVGVWVPIAAVLTAGANLFGGPIAGVVQLAALAAVWGSILVAVVRSGSDAKRRAGAVAEVPAAL